MPTIYPLFKPHDWPHARFVAHRQLLQNVPRAPLVAFGFDAGEMYQFVTKDKVDDVDALYQEALSNLANLDYPWELGDSHGLRFAASSGNEFSAERVLDRQAMNKAHALLESDRIVVAAPRRTCLIATRDGLPAEVMGLFVQLVMYTYNDDSYGHAPISPAMYVVEDGEIRNVLFADEMPATSPPRAARPWWKFWG